VQYKWQPKYKQAKMVTATILVGHSYGGFVITNAAYNNSNVTGLVYLAAFAPDEGESLADFVPPESLPPGFRYNARQCTHHAIIAD
jgi:pimeloyl-ACP methyl ester carboxylesterase